MTVRNLAKKPVNAPPADIYDTAWFESAILVYGPRKGGTTLLQNLLDGGDAVFVYPAELKLKQLLFGARDASTGRRYAELSKIPTVDIPNFDQALYRCLVDEALVAGGITNLKSMIRIDLDLVRRCVRSGGVPDPSHWAAKEVGGRTTEIVDWWLESFASPRVVFILRDPLKIARAVLRTRRRHGKRQSIGDIFYEVMDPLRVMRAQQSMLGRENVFAVAYEDLVADPAAVMRRLSRFLGVPYGPHFNHPTIFGESVVVQTASRKSKDVFADNARWQDDLTLRERSVVRLATLWARIRGLWIDYGKLRQRLRD